MNTVGGMLIGRMNTQLGFQRALPDMTVEIRLGIVGSRLRLIRSHKVLFLYRETRTALNTIRHVRQQRETWNFCDNKERKLNRKRSLNRVWGHWMPCF